MSQARKMIRPVSDLRNNFADISRAVHETQKPVFLTKNGFGDMVVLRNMRLESEIYVKLRDAEREDENGGKRYTPEEVFKEVESVINGNV